MNFPEFTKEINDVLESSPPLMRLYSTVQDKSKMCPMAILQCATDMLLVGYDIDRGQSDDRLIDDYLSFELYYIRLHERLQ